MKFQHQQLPSDFDVIIHGCELAYWCKKKCCKRYKKKGKQPCKDCPK